MLKFCAAFLLSLASLPAFAANVTATTGWLTKDGTTALNGDLTIDAGADWFVIINIDRATGDPPQPSCTLDGISPTHSIEYQSSNGHNFWGWLWSSAAIASTSGPATTASCSSSSNDTYYVYGAIEDTSSTTFSAFTGTDSTQSAADPVITSCTHAANDLVIAAVLDEADATTITSWESLSELEDVQGDATTGGFAAGNNGGDATITADIAAPENADGVCLVFVDDSGSTPAFSSGPTESPATNGFTIAGTITGSGTLTVEAVACNPGDAAPNNTELEAGQCGGGNAAQMNASEVWTTGVANDFLLTSANKPARFDVYVAGTNGTDDTAVSSFTDQDRSPRSGFAILALTSLSASSIFDCTTCVNGGSGDDYFAPDVATGDVIEYEDDTNEDADCNVAFEADGDFEMTPVGAGDCDGSRSFEISYQDVSSATDGLFNVGTFATDDTITNGNAVPLLNDGEELSILIALDEAMTAVDLDARWTDPEAGAVTVSFPTTLPTGLSVSAGNLVGTPTVCGVFTETERGTDPTGGYAEVEAVIAIGPRMPDLVGMTEAEAIAAIEALCP